MTDLRISLQVEDRIGTVLYGPVERAVEIDDAALSYDTAVRVISALLCADGKAEVMSYLSELLLERSQVSLVFWSPSDAKKHQVTIGIGDGERRIIEEKNPGDSSVIARWAIEVSRGAMLTVARYYASRSHLMRGVLA